ncbi:MAG: flagellar basal body rod C-terminal domain-containing protein [Planctomycetota bacterium]
MSLDNVLSGFNVSGSGMAAERARLDVIAGNIANATVNSDSPQGPYRRRRVVFQTLLDREALGAQRSAVDGVKVLRIEKDFDNPLIEVEENGRTVYYPNVNVAMEMTHMITALRTYEANALASQTLKNMAQRALRS